MSSRTLWFVSGVLLVGALMALGASLVGAIVVAIIAHALHEAWLHAIATVRRRREVQQGYEESQPS